MKFISPSSVQENPDLILTGGIIFTDLVKEENLHDGQFRRTLIKKVVAILPLKGTKVSDIRVRFPGELPNNPKDVLVALEIDGTRRIIKGSTPDLLIESFNNIFQTQITP